MQSGVTSEEQSPCTCLGMVTFPGKEEIPLAERQASIFPGAFSETSM